MKQLTRIRLITGTYSKHDDHVQRHDVPHRVNGVGKSTILDACSSRWWAASVTSVQPGGRSGRQRTLAAYVRGELGTEGSAFLRDDATGVVALEFRNPDGSHFLTAL